MRVTVTVTLTPDDDAWCSVNEAARRLGVTPNAVRGRIERGTVRTKPNGNHGRLVHVPKPMPVTLTPTVPVTVPLTVTEPMTLTVPDTVTLTPDPLVVELRERIAGLEARLGELRADAEREKGERQRERDRADHLTDQVADLARDLARVAEEAGGRERELTARAFKAEAELAALRGRPWWRRLAG